MDLLQPHGLQLDLQGVSTTFQPAASYAWHTLNTEREQVDWLILHFNQWFSHHQTILQRAAHEPEYFPAKLGQPARIEFAHGFLSSALHEISHWCIAGAARRQLPDLGYWYEPDGRSAAQQALFEQVEVKPQAIEWLFSQAMRRRFQVSLDNLNGNAGDGAAFKDAVYAQVQAFLSGQATLPRDAAVLIEHLCGACRGGQTLQAHEFGREQLD